MIFAIGVFQLFVFLVLHIWERLAPMRQDPRPRHFNGWWFVFAVFAGVWLQCLVLAWGSVPSLIDIEWPPLVTGLAFFFLYSFVNYWVHRWKHSNYYLWHYIHKVHHSPSHMETRIAFYRHPLEVVFNTLVILIYAKLLLGLPLISILVALTIEGCLECFHHSNIKIGDKFKKIGKYIQLPEMHLVHHELGAHKNNYATILWDWVFKTLEVPTNWNKKLGFKGSVNVTNFIWHHKHH